MLDVPRNRPPLALLAPGVVTAAMTQRYHVPTPIDFDADRRCVVTLDGAEAHHLLQVMRVTAGDAVTLFDGSGAEFAAEVLEVSKREVALIISRRVEVDREAPADIVLGVALPKGDRQKVLVEKLTELGVTRLAPLVTERSVAVPKAAGVEKLRRAVVEASKQCGRNRLMCVDEPTPLAEFLAATDAAQRVVADPLADAVLSPLAGSFAAVVGPEGGLTPAELAAASDAGWRPVGLGPRVLRVETAAITLAAIRATTVAGG